MKTNLIGLIVFAFVLCFMTTGYASGVTSKQHKTYKQKSQVSETVKKNLYKTDTRTLRYEKVDQNNQGNITLPKKDTKYQKPGFDLIKIDNIKKFFGKFQLLNISMYDKQFKVHSHTLLA